MPPKPESKGAPAEAEAAPAKVEAAAPGGIKAWLPLLANIILMPVMAYVTAVFILPHQSKTASTTASASAKGESSSKEKGKEGGGEKGEKSEKGEKKESSGKKPSAPLNDKVLVNLSGSQGTRYLLAKIVLVGSTEKVSNTEALKALIEENNAALIDTAMSTLRVKTINDLEKPGAMNLIRAQLISAFNEILGAGTVEGILLTEFAIQ